ncbi:hypothetical protein CEXT_760411 [Caerostris extrusa]|uniref:Uncharacterized protein n=1 Tax=Caerostris extrusa TaxID=172846 RepID=A0AAV4THH9_CAEEX|nr:hypothetical protein CEXT_760411 [Caerostris extrusa]
MENIVFTMKEKNALCVFKETIKCILVSLLQIPSRTGSPSPYPPKAATRLGSNPFPTSLPHPNSTNGFRQEWSTSAAERPAPPAPYSLLQAGRVRPTTQNHPGLTKRTRPWT